MDHCIRVDVPHLGREEREGRKRGKEGREGRKEENEGKEEREQREEEREGRKSNFINLPLVLHSDLGWSDYRGVIQT